jgi:hypothetical protein
MQKPRRAPSESVLFSLTQRILSSDKENVVGSPREPEKEDGMIGLGRGPRRIKQIKHIGSSIYARCELGKFQPVLTTVTTPSRPVAVGDSLASKAAELLITPRKATSEAAITSVAAHSVRKYFK